MRLRRVIRRPLTAERQAETVRQQEDEVSKVIRQVDQFTDRLEAQIRIWQATPTKGHPHSA